MQCILIILLLSSLPSHYPSELQPLTQRCRSGLVIPKRREGSTSSTGIRIVRNEFMRAMFSITIHQVRVVFPEGFKGNSLSGKIPCNELSEMFKLEAS